MMIVYIDKNGNYGFEGVDSLSSWSCDTIWNVADPPLPLPVFKKDCHGKGHASILAFALFLAFTACKEASSVAKNRKKNS